MVLRGTKHPLSINQLQKLLSESVSRQQRGPADILLDFLSKADPPLTYLAICPNSEAVAAAALAVAGRLQFPLFFAATLNQIDRTEGYTSWTPAGFTHWVSRQTSEMSNAPAVIIGLDHGGPWKKDVDYLRKIKTDRAIEAIEDSIEACLLAGYQLLHIDATEDPFVPGPSVPLKTIVERTVHLIRFAEKVRETHRLVAVSYEVGTEEVSGGLTSIDRFRHFVEALHIELTRSELEKCWPCFFVGDVGTDLFTTRFDANLANSLAEIIRPYGSWLKGHYTDFVDRPSEYPRVGMGGANVGPEFSAIEFDAVMRLATGDWKSGVVGSSESVRGAGVEMEKALRQAVVETDRWRKWLREGEEGTDFEALSSERQKWLLSTGSRYIWAEDKVVAARGELYESLAGEVDGPTYVQQRLEESIGRYADAFGLIGVSARISEYLQKRLD